LEDVVLVYLVRIGVTKETVSRIGMINTLLVLCLPLLIAKLVTGKQLET